MLSTFRKRLLPKLKALNFSSGSGPTLKNCKTKGRPQLPQLPYGDHFGVKNEDIGLKNTIFGTLIQNNQADSLDRP